MQRSFGQPLTRRLHFPKGFASAWSRGTLGNADALSAPREAFPDAHGLRQRALPGVRRPPGKSEGRRGGKEADPFSYGGLKEWRSGCEGIDLLWDFYSP